MSWFCCEYTDMCFQQCAEQQFDMWNYAIFAVFLCSLAYRQVNKPRIKSDKSDIVLRHKQKQTLRNSHVPQTAICGLYTRLLFVLHFCALRILLLFLCAMHVKKGIFTLACADCMCMCIPGTDRGIVSWYVRKAFAYLLCKNLIKKNKKKQCAGSINTGVSQKCRT